jgi:hypothetical protein
MFVPLAGESLPEGPVTVRIVLEGPSPMYLMGDLESRVSIGVVHAEDDGLRLLSADTAAIYERTTSLHRYRMASQAIVEPSSWARVRMLQAGVPDDAVVLSEDPSVPGGGQGRIVSIDQSDPDDREIVVDSDGTSFLVIADALRDDWSATIDGVPAELLSADHAFMAVVVPDGEHTIRLRYSLAGWPASGWVAALAVAALVALVVVDRRRARPATPSTPRDAPAEEPDPAWDTTPVDARQADDVVEPVGSRMRGFPSIEPPTRM